MVSMSVSVQMNCSHTYLENEGGAGWKLRSPTVLVLWWGETQVIHDPILTEFPWQ